MVPKPETGEVIPLVQEDLRVWSLPDGQIEHAETFEGTGYRVAVER